MFIVDASSCFLNFEIKRLCCDVSRRLPGKGVFLRRQAGACPPDNHYKWFFQKSPDKAGHTQGDTVSVMIIVYKNFTINSFSRIIYARLELIRRA
ncbi:MAG: hypothetical protein LUC48_00930 [Clostridiales bacterium]|nr:hypothetical protein [Clostridiales bacterium]